MIALKSQDTIVLNKDISIPKKGIICAHPARVKKIAENYLKKVTLHTDYRGYQVYSGVYKGQALFVANTGIGAPAAAFLIEELVAFGVEEVIRLGSNDSAFVGYGLNLINKTSLPLGLLEDYSLPNLNCIDVHQELKHRIMKSAEQMGITLNISKNQHIDGYYARFKHREGSSDMETGALYLLGNYYHLKFASILMSYPKHDGKGEYGEEEALVLEDKAIKLALKSLAENKKPLVRGFF